jgi:arylsulfatase A-like enzyme
MIVRLPGAVEPGSACHEPVSSIDFFPTMLEAAGAKVDLPNPIDGVSLMGLLAGGRRLTPHRPLFWHYPHYHDGKPSSSVRDGDWKLIEFYEDGRLELYNLADDLGEGSDLAGKMPAKAAAMRKELDGWRKAVGAKLPWPNPKYDPALADSDPRTPVELAAWRESVGAQPR